MKRLILVLAAIFCLSATLAQTPSKLDGWISDSMCGAKHVGDNPQCVKRCIQSMGAKPVFVDAAKKQVWAIDNPDTVKPFLGNHVAVTVVLDDAQKSVHIQAIQKAD